MSKGMAQGSGIWHSVDAGLQEKPMQDETNLSYLSAFYYTAAVLLILTGVFAAVSHSWWMAAACFFSGSVLFGYRIFGSRGRK